MVESGDLVPGAEVPVRVESLHGLQAVRNAGAAGERQKQKGKNRSHT